MQLQGDGPVRLLVVECTDKLELRAMALWDAARDESPRQYDAIVLLGVMVDDLVTAAGSDQEALDESLDVVVVGGDAVRPLDIEDAGRARPRCAAAVTVRLHRGGPSCRWRRRGAAPLRRRDRVR